MVANPTIPFEDDASIPAALLLFNLRLANTADDAAIERLAQEGCKFLIHRAEKRKLTMQEVICATQEMMSRFLVAPVMCGAQDQEAAEKLIVSMMGVATRRALDMLEGNAPGQGSQAGEDN